MATAEIDLLAEAMATALNAVTASSTPLPAAKRRRAKVDFAALRRAREIVAYLTGQIAEMAPAGLPNYLQARAAARPAGGHRGNSRGAGDAFRQPRVHR